MQFQLRRAFEVLERIPGTFRALLDGLPEAWTAPNEGPDTFSAFDNVGHLIHGERTDWIPRTRIILAQGPSRHFEPFDRFAHYRESRGKSMTQLLDEFAVRSVSMRMKFRPMAPRQPMGCRSTGRPPDCYSGSCRFESCRPSCERP